MPPAALHPVHGRDCQTDGGATKIGCAASCHRSSCLSWRRPRRKGDRVERRTAEVDLEVVEAPAPAPEIETDDPLLAGLDSVMAGMEARLATIRAL